MVFTGTNTTGWSELMNGDIVQSAFKMYDTALSGWTIFILFVVYEIMLFNKTQNLTLCWVTGLFFATLWGASATILRPISLYIMFLILTFLLAGILYMIFWK